VGGGSGLVVPSSSSHRFNQGSNMEQTGNLLKWKLTLAETLAFGATLTVIITWMSTNYQSKSEALKLENRIERVETEISQMRDGINKISADVSYIRGRLEPRTK